MGAASPEDRVPFQHLWQDGVGGGSSCSPKPDAPSRVLCCCPPPALASQTTAACGESGWSLWGWAQVLGREGGGRGSGEAVSLWPGQQALPHWDGGASMITPLSLPQEVNSCNGEGVSGDGIAHRTPGSCPASPPGSLGFSEASCPWWRGSTPPQPSSPTLPGMEVGSLGVHSDTGLPSQAGLLLHDLSRGQHQVPFHQGL